MGHVLVALEIVDEIAGHPAVLAFLHEKRQGDLHGVAPGFGQLPGAVHVRDGDLRGHPGRVQNRDQHHRDDQHHGRHPGQGRVVDRDAGPQGGAGKKAGRHLGHQVPQHHTEHRKGQGFGDEQKRHVGGSQSHRGVDGDFPLAFIDAADHGV